MTPFEHSYHTMNMRCVTTVYELTPFNNTIIKENVFYPMFLFALCVAVFAGSVEIDAAVNKRCSDV